MRHRNKEAVRMFKRRSRCVGCVKLPVVGLADVHVEDGDAILFPGTGGAIRVGWFTFCRFLRRHK